jgi:nicotinate-nucleotide adenylyltransferase
VSGPRVALYGGSFDPPHVAHVLAVAWLRSAAPVDAVWLLPVANHPHGKRTTDFALRVQMVRAAMSVFADGVEVRLDEAEPGATGRSLDLVQTLVARHPRHRFRFVLGTDQVAIRDRWHRFDALAALAPPIVLGRPGIPGAPGLEPAIDLPDVSSTDLRRRVAHGESTAGLLPDAVRRLVDAHGLYRESE